MAGARCRRSGWGAACLYSTERRKKARRFWLKWVVGAAAARVRGRAAEVLGSGRLKIHPSGKACLFSIVRRKEHDSCEGGARRLLRNEGSAILRCNLGQGVRALLAWGKTRRRKKRARRKEKGAVRPDRGLQDAPKGIFFRFNTPTFHRPRNSMSKFR